jgi:hypothetical protein
MLLYDFPLIFRELSSNALNESMLFIFRYDT